MEQEQAGVELIRPYIKQRYPMYVDNPGFETWLFSKAGTDEQKLDEYLELLRDYGYLHEGGRVADEFDYRQAPEPSQVMEDINRRLSALDEGTRAVLRRASVEGDRFSMAVLEASDGGQGGIQGRLQPAIEAGVIAPDRNISQTSALGHHYRFVPLQVRDVLYKELTEPERARYHTDLVEYLSAELERTEDTGARDMLSRMISEHNKRFTRPDPSPSKE